MNTSENSQPSYMLKTQRMICVWKSIIAWEFLQELWIKFDALNVWGHSALMVKLTDWKEYYFDPTNATDIAEFQNLEKVEWWVYEKWNLILLNKFEKWWQIDTWSNWATTDRDWKLNFSRTDKEFWLIWQLYNNKWYEDLLIKEDILFLQRAIELNQNMVEPYTNLVIIYNKIWNYEAAIKIWERWLKLNPEDNYVKWLLANSYSEIALVEYQKWNKEIALEIAEKSELYKPNIKSYNLIWVLSDELWNKQKALDKYLKWIELFWGNIFKELPNIRWKLEHNERDSFTNTINNINLLINNFEDNKKYEVYYEIWKSFMYLEEYDIAKEYFNKTIEIWWKYNWIIYYYLWVIEEHKWNLEETLKNFEKASQLVKDDYIINRELIRIKLKIQKQKQLK